MFARHAAATVDVELALHESLLPELGLDPARLEIIPVSPTTLGYTSYLLATAHGGSFAEGLAAVLPCYWIYARVGAALLDRGSPDLRYQRWIDTYGGAEFAATVAEVLACGDAVGAGLGSADDARARRHFAITSRHRTRLSSVQFRESADLTGGELGCPTTAARRGDVADRRRAHRTVAAT